MNRIPLKERVDWIWFNTCDNAEQAVQHLQHMMNIPMHAYFDGSLQFCIRIASDLQIDQSDLSRMRYIDVARRIADLYKVPETRERAIDAAWQLAMPFIRENRRRRRNGTN